MELLIPAGNDRAKLAALDEEENTIRARQLRRGQMRERWKKNNTSISLSDSYSAMMMDGKTEWEDLNRIERIHEEKERIIKKHVHN
jgi:anti-sigma28 factor (negative regulator of flagellin synthesis)